MDDNMTDGNAKASARRRLIRGAFAAPAALTLCSGSAFAQASNPASCIAKQTEPGATQAAYPLGDDTGWLAVERLEAGGKYYARVGDVSAAAGPAGSFADSNSSQWVEIFSPPAEPAYSNTIVNESNAGYVALLMDPSGYVVGFGTGGTPFAGTGTAGQSCWASFSPPAALA